MRTTRQMTHAALIAAVYVLFTFLSSLFGLSSGMIQLRLSEALTVLPVFTPAAVPGLAVGCLLSNILTGCAVWDVAFGSLATLLGAIGTRLLRRQGFLAYLPPVLSNTLIVPCVLIRVYGVPSAWWLVALCVLAGELLSCVLLGSALRRILQPHKDRLFRI